jgi:hypothetical protein
MKLRHFVPLLGIAVLAQSALAQGLRPKQPPVRFEVPRNQRPPAGMCRIWIENVPAAKQPAPTDCATAIRNRPPNGRVIFSEDEAKKNEKGRDRDRDTDEEKKPARKAAPRDTT